MDNKTFMDVASLKTALVPLGTTTADLSSDMSDLDDSNSELIENWIGDSMVTYMLVDEYVHRLIHKETKIEEKVIEMLEATADIRTDIDQTEADVINGG